MFRIDKRQPVDLVHNQMHVLLDTPVGDIQELSLRVDAPRGIVRCREDQHAEALAGLGDVPARRFQMVGGKQETVRDLRKLMMRHQVVALDA